MNAKAMKLNDSVNHPNHYCEGRRYEPWDVIVDWKLDYLTGSAVKYLSRAGRKDQNKEVEDLRKAIAYIEKRIEVLESRKSEDSDDSIYNDDLDIDD